MRVCLWCDPEYKKAVLEALGNTGCMVVSERLHVDLVMCVHHDHTEAQALQETMQDRCGLLIVCPIRKRVDLIRDTRPLKEAVPRQLVYDNHTEPSLGLGGQRWRDTMHGSVKACITTALKDKDHMRMLLETATGKRDVYGCVRPRELSKPPPRKTSLKRTGKLGTDDAPKSGLANMILRAGGKGKGKGKTNKGETLA
jgi:hypothetical protein